jgi:hypothetical protein
VGNGGRRKPPQMDKVTKSEQKINNIKMGLTTIGQNVINPKKREKRTTMVIFVGKAKKKKNRKNLIRPSPVVVQIYSSSLFVENKSKNPAPAVVQMHSSSSNFFTKCTVAFHF